MTDQMKNKLTRELISRAFAIVMFIIMTVVGLAFSIYLLFHVTTAYMQVLTVAFMLLNAVCGFFNIFTSYSYYRSYLYENHLKEIQKSVKPITYFPTVAIAMPVHNEDTALVKRNLLQLMKLEYPKSRLSFYLLDDSTGSEARKQLREFSKSKNIFYMHRENRKGFKAGALNNLLKHMKEEYLAIFDYDEYLRNKNFLLDLLPYFEDKKLAYVQTEKRFFKGNFFSDTVDIFDAFFYKFIQPSRALNNAAIFGGSCGIIRVRHLNKIGGFPEYVTEDTFFSFESNVNGFKSIYIPKVYAFGKPITNFTDLAKQQWRYNYGDTQFLKYFVKRMLSRSSKKPKTAIASLDYLTHGFGLNYISVILFLFTVISIFIVFSQISMTTSTSISSLLTGKDLNLDFEALGIAAFTLSVFAPVVITKIYFKSFRKGLMMFILNFALVFIRIKAAFSTLFNLKNTLAWEFETITNQRKRMLFALKNSVLEAGFSAILFVLGALALLINNLYGGLWLLWYGSLYISTAYMFYRYK